MGLATIILIRKQLRTICVPFNNFQCASSQFNEHEYIAVSLAKLQTSVSLMKNIRSSMKRLNEIGPCVDPCGTPLRIPGYELKVDPVFTG